MIETFLFTIRIFLAIIFAVSGIPKLFNFHSFREGVATYDIVKKDILITLLSTVFVVLEIFISISFFINQYLFYSSLLGLTVLGIYGIAVSINLSREKEINCHCFDSIGKSQLTFATLTRILFLAILMTTSIVFHYITVDYKQIINEEAVFYFFLLFIMLFINEVLQKGLTLYRNINKEYN